MTKSIVSNALLDDVIVEALPHLSSDEEIRSLRRLLRPSLNLVVAALQQSVDEFHRVVGRESLRLCSSSAQATTVFQRFLHNVTLALD
jgi:hypothetical protein